MAEDGKEKSNEGGSWWGSWINSAKNKTSTVFEAVKKDLDELSTAVRTEASNVGAAIESTLFNEEESPVGTVKKSLSSFFGQVSEALIPTLDGDDEVEAVLITRDGTITLTGFQKHLADLQRDDKTYLDEPVKELHDKYKLWMEVIEQDQFTQDRLAKHLACSEILNEKYLLLVPEQISHMDFWQRYLFKRALLEDAIANAEIAERRAKIELNSTKPTSPRKNIIQTEQPKLTCNEKDIIEHQLSSVENTATEIATTAADAIVVSAVDKDNDDKQTNQQQQQKQDEKPKQQKSTEFSLEDDGENLESALLGENIWENEDIPSNVELSEEEQIRLLEEYELEIQQRDKKRNEKNGNSNNNDNKIKKTNDGNNAKSSSSAVTKTTIPQTSSKIAQKKSNSKNTITQKPSTAAMTTTKSPSKTTTVTKTPTKISPQKQQKSQPQQQQQIHNKDNSDSLIVQNEHFNKDESTSSTSEESWEKDFDLND